MVSILASLNAKKVTRKHFNVVFWGKASSPLCNVGATWQPEHKHFHSVLLTTDKQYLECLTPGVFTEACKKLELQKAIVSIVTADSITTNAFKQMLKSALAVHADTL